MKVYHGSTVCVSKPELLTSSRRLDFGSGFYVTSDLHQAQRWTQIKMRRLQTNSAIVSVYDAKEVFSAIDLIIKYFVTTSEEWLDFVMAYRMGSNNKNSGYDVIRGPVANDTLCETLALYERGILTHSETIVRLKTHELADHVVLVTNTAVSLLKFINCEDISK